MDSKADGEEIIYPYLCFSVDNFDEAFEDIQVNYLSTQGRSTAGSTTGRGGGVQQTERRLSILISVSLWIILTRLLKIFR